MKGDKGVETNGVRANGSRQLLAFLSTQGESQAAWEGFLVDSRATWRFKSGLQRTDST